MTAKPFPKRSDIYVLACSVIAIILFLFDLLTGESPFNQDLVLGEIVLALLYFIFSRERFMRKFRALGLDKPVFFVMMFMLSFQMLAIILSAIL